MQSQRKLSVALSAAARTSREPASRRAAAPAPRAAASNARRPRQLRAAALAGVLLASVPLVLALAPGGAAAEAAPMRFGMDMNSIQAQVDAGVAPDYGSFWIGPWTLESGWGSSDRKLDEAYARGITPVIQYYYWGDDISPSCVENGCWSTLHDAWKDRAGWQRLGEELVQHLRDHMKGRPAVVILETEFNKGGIEKYEPYDGYLAEKARLIKDGYPATQLVLGFGNWNSAAWGNFDRAAAASDLTGIQALRSSVRNSLDSYRGLVELLLGGAQKLQALFGKPVFVTDMGLSSYPEPEYLDHQAAEVRDLFARLPDLKAAGVTGMMYRTFKDNPGMDTANYHREAERHWGFAWGYNLTWKPSMHAWVQGVQAERANPAPGGSPPPPPPPPPPPVPVDPAGAQVEVEAFAARTAGGAQSDPAASGGRVWNLWSNGHVAQGLDFFAAGTYELKLRARGTAVDGVGPHVVVTIDGAKVLEADLPAGEYRDLAAMLDIPAAGARELRMAFTNDARAGTEDRNLVLDVVQLARPNRAPEATFAWSAAGLQASFDASGSRDADGDALSFAWAFGDGARGDGAAVAHAYAAAGTYQVELAVSDGRATTIHRAPVTVERPNQAPTARLSWSADGLTVRVDASASSDPDGDALAFRWDFGDGAAAEGATAAHTYAAAGTYAVALLASDGRAEARASEAVQVSRPAMAASFAVSPNVNEWWVEVRVQANEAVRAVDAQVNGGTWQGLELKGWGAWAKSMKVPKGSQVVFRATGASGQSALSEPVTWLGPAEPEPLRATFTPKARTNNHWVEVKVACEVPIVKVEMRTNGGAWTAMDRTDWGSWARKGYVADGTPVEFRATDGQGRTALSSAYRWG